MKVLGREMDPQAAIEYLSEENTKLAQECKHLRALVELCRAYIVTGYPLEEVQKQLAYDAMGKRSYSTHKDAAAK